ncbi:MAG: cytochrome c [Luteolibacter sp.]
MKTHPILHLALCGFLLTACDSKEQATRKASSSPSPSQLAKKKPQTRGKEIKSVDLTNPLNQQWVTKGKAVYEMKCLACHKLTADKLVGPGWAGVTKRREPVWIMNMITNVDMMLDTDPEAQKMLEECLVRMPDQNVSPQEARELLEFMRSNDGEK